MLINNSTSLSRNRVMAMDATSLSMDAGSYSSGLISIFPESILEKSRISLIILSNALPDVFIWVM